MHNTQQDTLLNYCLNLLEWISMVEINTLPVTFKG